MRTLANCCANSILLHAAPAWFPFCTATQQHRLQSLEMQAARVGALITGNSSWSATALEVGIPSLEAKILAQCLRVALNARSRPETPLAQHLLAPPRRVPGKLRKGFKQFLQDGLEVAKCNIHDIHLKVSIDFPSNWCIHYQSHLGCHPPRGSAELRNHFLQYWENLPIADYVLWVDGSVSGARAGGAYYLVSSAGERDGYEGCRASSSARSEQWALSIGIQALLDLEPAGCVHICIDSQAALHAIDAGQVFSPLGPVLERLARLCSNIALKSLISGYGISVAE